MQFKASRIGKIGILSVVLWVSAGLVTGQAGEAAVPEPPVLPKDIDALPADLNRRMKDLIKAAEKYRGLRTLQGVPCGALGEMGLKRKMLQAFQEELPAEKMNVLEASLKALKLIPDTMILNEYYPKLLTSQVGGYYDPRRKYLTIVLRDGGVLGKEAREKYGDGLADRMEETVLVHELTHALQDQHFNLQKFAISDPLSDEGAARTALIEGDATLTMYNYFSGMNLEEMPGVEEIMGQMFNDPKKLMDMSADMPGGKEMADAPAWFRDNLLFSYLQGFVFCMNVKRKGGQKLLDCAFTTNPPRSTEQILHPEKWYGKRDDPVEVVFPDLTDALPGYKKISEGQMGEQSIRVFLNEYMKDPKLSAAAAEGWGGDRFAVYEKDNNRVLAWITEWDSNQESKKFKEACAGLGAEWNVELSRPSRVQIVRGKLNAAEMAALKKKLAGAEAKMPENKALDLAALGVAEHKASANGAGKDDQLAEELSKLEGLLGGDGKKGAKNKDIGDLLNDPNLKKMAEGLLGGKDGKGGDAELSLDKLMNDPAIQKMAEGFLGGKGGANGGLDLGQMMKDPAVQEMLKKMMSQERPKGKTSADGRTYTNEPLGYSISLPESAKGWKLDGKPPVPMASVMISDPTGEAQITVVTQGLPMAMPIETMGPMLEMAPQMAMQNYKRISAGAVESGTKKGYELQYEGSLNDQKVHFIQRYYSSGNTMIVVSAMTPGEAWEKHAKNINDTLKTFSFSEVKAKADAGDGNAKEK